MDCKRASKILKRLALSESGEPISPALAAHLAECESCRESFAREQEFVAAMNLGLASAVSGEPSPALRVRIREQIAEPVAQFDWLAAPRWQWAAVGAIALCAIAISLRVVRSRETPSPAVVTSGGSAAPVIVSNSNPAPTAPGPRIRPTAPLTQARAIHRDVALAGLPPVLIDSSEREAIALFLHHFHAGPVGAAPVGVEQQSDEIASLEITPLEIKPLDIPLLPRTDAAFHEESAPQEIRDGLTP